MNLLMLLFVLIAIPQCTNNQTAKIDFPENRWYQSEVLSLAITPDSNIKSYVISLKLSYIYGYQFSEIPLELYITSPLHQVEKIPVTIPLFDENNTELGECLGDYCDIEFIIRDEYQFSEKGKYKLQVLNTFDYDYLPNVLSVSLQVK